MSKDYIEYQEIEDDNYGVDSGESIDLLDDIDELIDEEAEDEEEAEAINTLNNLQIILDQELDLLESERTCWIDFIDDGKKYSGLVMGKSKIHKYRYIFKVKEGKDYILKAFWINKIELL